MAHGAHNGLGFRNKANAFGPVFRILPIEAVLNSRHFDLRRFDRDLRLHAGEDVQVANPALGSHRSRALGIEGNGGPKFHRRALYRKLKPHGHHTHDGERLAAQSEALANDFRIGSEAVLPEAVTQDDGQAGAGGLVFLGNKISADNRGNAQHGEHIGGNNSASQVSGLASPCKCEIIFPEY